MLRHLPLHSAIMFLLSTLPLVGRTSAIAQGDSPPKQGAPKPAGGTSGPTIEQFIKMHWPTNGTLSKTGTFYYVELVDGVNQLHTRASGESAGKAITSFPDGVGDYSVSYDGRWVAITAGVGGDEQFNVHLLDAESDRIEPILIDRDTVFGSIVWRRGSNEFAYRANKHVKENFNVFIYDVVSRNSRLFYDEPGHWFPADFSDHSEMLAIVQTVSSTESNLRELSLQAITSRPITWSTTPWSHEPVGYFGNDHRFLLVSDYQGDTKRLISVDLVSGEFKLESSELAKYEIDLAVMNEGRDLVAVVVNEDGYGRLHLYSMPQFLRVKGPEIPKGVVRNVRFTGRTLLYSLENANTPGLIYKWDVDKPNDAPVCLTQADTQGVDVTMFKLPELVRYKSFDGLEVPAFLYLPGNHARGTPIPFIVQYHGGPEGQTRPGFDRVIQYFLTRGFGVIAPNVRGSSGYGRKYLEMDNYKKRMDSVKDGVAAAQWLVDSGYSKPKMIAAYGGSYGGFMVMAAITQAPELFGAACDVVGIVNFETFLQRTKDYRRKLREAEYGPLSDAEFLRSISPIHQLEKVQAPVLIAHGRNDPRVPINEAEQLFEKLKGYGREPKLIVFDDEGHGFAKEANRIKFYRALSDFFEEHLRKN